ncbi:MAG: riboflavin synthase [Proteobacteria bacterium]|nr:riboflavin synthase [Pseudomonadota bacterium]
MFTGLIETTGQIRRILPADEGVQLTISSSLRNYQLGESIAVNGICLTVISFDHDSFRADASSETLARTNLGTLHPGDEVHLERALKLGDRLGGHWVSGHIDGTGTIAHTTPHGSSLAVTIQAAPNLLRYIVEKGSVTLDGASLTVNRVDNASFEIMMIPHTQSVLAKSFTQPGRIVNIEVDILGKYVEKLLSCHNDKQSDIDSAPSSLSLQKLREAGFY